MSLPDLRINLTFSMPEIGSPHFSSDPALTILSGDPVNPLVYTGVMIRHTPSSTTNNVRITLSRPEPETALFVFSPPECYVVEMEESGSSGTVLYRYTGAIREVGSGGPDETLWMAGTFMQMGVVTFSPVTPEGGIPLGT